MQGDCCTATPGIPGCTNKAIETCICEENKDGYCCQNQWDQSCISEIKNVGCAAQCGSGSSGAGGSSGSAGAAGAAGSGGVEKSCCEVNTEAYGCTDKAIQECVCSKQDGAPCCNPEEGTGWDDVCVFLVGDLACGTACE